MAKIISFETYTKKGPKMTSPALSCDLSLNDIKIKFIEYFSETQIADIHLKPVNLNCPYEKLLINVCSVAINTKNKDKSMAIAEYIYQQDLKGLSLNGFIDCINQDDLIMACLQVELKKLKQVDRLFLVNVLKAKFPKEEASINLLKTFLFAQDQDHKLEIFPQLNQQS